MAEALRAGGAEVNYTELPRVDHDACTPAFDSPELPVGGSPRIGDTDEAATAAVGSLSGGLALA